MIGRMVASLGERTAMGIEYTGLLALFLAYAGLYAFGWAVWIAAALYVIDHVLFAMALSLKTYIQKIADPRDIAPTAAVAFTVNHIAARLPAGGLGYLWMVNPPAVFVLAAVLAATLARLCRCSIPRHPEQGQRDHPGPRRTAALPPSS